MNLNGASSSFPQPSAGCNTFAPLLPLLRTGELAGEQAHMVETHVATCAWCGAKLAQYDVVYAGLRRHFSPTALASSRPIPTLAEIANLAEELELPESAPATARVPLPAHQIRRVAAAMPAVAAVLLVALLGGMLAWHQQSGSRPHTPIATPTRILDPTSAAYVGVLRTYYPPFSLAEEQEYEQCALPITHMSPPQDLAPCRPVELAAISAAQTLLDHLAGTPAPVRWQAQDAALKQAVQAALAYNTKRVHYIDTKDVLQFYFTRDAGSAAGGLLCTTILQIDRGPPPLSPGLPLPDYALSPDNSPGCAQG
jgi:hypothetical protein